MSVFRYSLLADSGRLRRGVAELPFEDESAAIRFLERGGEAVVSIDTLRGLSHWLWALKWRLRSRVGRTELAEFFNNLSMMLASGVPILGALRELGADTRHPTFRAVLSFITADIECGQTMAAAVARQRRVFPPVVCNMVAVGEETGRLDQMCASCAEHLDNVQQIISGTRRALLYPCTLLLVITGAVVFWFTFVVPELVGLFKGMGVTLPWLTRQLLVAAEFLQAHLTHLLIGTVLLAFIAMMLRRSWHPFRYATDRLLLSLPLVRDVIELSSVARISEYLGLMLGAGVGVLRTFDIIIDSVPNLVFKDRLTKTRQGIETGSNISTSLRAENAVHPFACRMLAVGERTGRIDAQARYVADSYRRRLSGMVETMGKTLEPLLIGVLGLIFIIFVIGLIAPIYDLIAGVR